jgi:N-acetylneuraminic acid mutarotase
VAVGSDIYIIGGLPQSGDALAQVDVFHTSSSTWNSVAPLTTNRSDPAAAVIGSTIYVFGGNNNTGMLASAEAYDTANPGLGWVPRASMPTARVGPRAGVINGKVYVVGGMDASLVQLRTVERYDPVSNSWSTAVPTNTAHHGGVGGVSGGRFYIIGGRDNGENTSVTEEGTLP